MPLSFSLREYTKEEGERERTREREKEREREGESEIERDVGAQMLRDSDSRTDQGTKGITETVRLKKISEKMVTRQICDSTQL